MTSNADDRDLIDAIEAWAEKELRPVARKFDQADEYPHEIVEQMKELGLFGATISPEYGGLGLSAWTYAQIVMKVSAIWMAPCGIFNSHLIMAAAIERSGTEAQKRNYLPRMATGEFRGGLGLTEPNAGSDLQAIRTLAKRDGDDYVVNGSKTWITNSLHGHGILLLVKTDPQAEPRHKGMSLLIKTTASTPTSCSEASKARASSKPPAAWSWAASTWLRAARASGRVPCITPCVMRRNAAPLANRSGTTRPSSSNSPTWSPRSRARVI
jgi:alkylation response protein AidB-like acyl-CoA dehydrogenase